MSIEGGKTFKLTSKRLELLQALRREQGLVPASGERIPRQPARETYPLSFNQQRLWLLDQLQPESAAYVLNQAMHLRGRLSLPALARSLTEVVCRHSVLRTVFEAVDGEPVQRIAVPAAVPLPVIDGSALAPAAREGWLKEVSNREARRPFDLSQGARGPLLRAHLLRLGAEEHVLLASVHHIATDGWSQGLLMRELAALYGAFARALPSPLPELPIQYADFACWQRGWLTDEVLEQQLAYWNETLSGAALLMLPTDRPRPPLETFRGASTIFMLDVETSAALRRLAQRQGSTLFMTLLAAFAALLCRYSGQAEVSIGSPTANRIRVELEGLIGFFVNTLVLRIDAAADPELGELLERVRRTVVGAFAHQDLPFERIVAELQPARDLSRSPLFQVMFILQNAQTIGGAAPVVEGLAMEPMGTTAGVARFDLTLSMTDAPEGIGGGLEYNVDLFDRTTIERLAGHLQTLLGAAALTAAPGSPSARLSELPLLSPAERHQLSVEWLDTRRAGPGETRVDLWIERQALARPEAAALCWVGGRMSYGELLAEAGRMARRLRARGLRPGEPVGVAVERSARLVPALLGIWQAGGAYLPMDPSYPEERLLYMLEDAGCRLVLIDEATPAALAQRSPVALWLGEGEAPGAFSADPTNCEPGEASAGPIDFAPGGGGAAWEGGALAYVLYTSGSTGRPKGVEVPHAALANFLASMAEQPGLGADDVLLAVTSLSFDIAGLELYLPLVVGGRIELASREEAGDGARLLSRLRSSGATAMQATPSTWRMLIDAGWQGEPAIKVLCGGEALPEKLAAELCARSPSVWNLYGPTETTVWSAAGRVEAGEAVAIGPPIANTTLYVLGRRLEPAPVGVPGELFIGGDGVALGYRGRAELTAERFLPDPFGDRCGRRGRPGARLYRTGDLVRWRPRGELEFLGRIDHQVKVRGFRIELGEVEAALEAHPAVARAVVVAQATPEAGGGRLVAYLVATPAASPPVRQAHPVPAPQAPFQPPAVPPAELRAFTSAKLPEHMVPAAFIWLAALPLTPNGKVDRRALPTPEETGQAGLTDAFVAPRNPVEELLAGIWCELLDLRRVGIHDNFFELGGHSLTATRLLARVRAALGVEVPLRRLFEAPTVEGLARLTELLRRGGAAGAEAAEVGEAPPIAPAAGRHEGELPLSFAQQRVWILDQLGLAGTAYNLTLAMRLRGALDVAALAAALDRLVERHEALRTSFPSAHGRPRQQIAPRAHLPLPVTDLSALPPARRDTEARRVASRLARLSFDLARGPLLRAALLALAEGEHVVGLTVHHIVADGWSLGILVRDVASLYEAAHLARVIGRAGPYSRRASPSLPPLPQLAVQYADFAAWQRGWLSGEVLDAQLAYWRQQLTDLPPALPLLADRPRRAGRSEQAGRRWFLLPDELAQELRALSRRLQVTPFMVLLGGFAALLSRYTGEHDVAIGTPIANRARVELEPLIGFFANTLVLRSDLSGDPEFRTLLGRVRSTALDAYAHQDLPFERLVEELQPERDLGVNPLFQVMFQMQNVPVPRIDLAGLSLEPMEIERGAAMFDLVLSLTDQGSFLAGTFEHDAKLFAAPTIQRLAAHFTSLLAGAVADPERRIGELPLLSAAERHQLSVEWLDTRRAGQGEARVDQWIERQARARPEAAALCWLGGRMSYGELVAEAAGMARRLRARGLRPGEPVGVAVERSARLVPALLGIWQAGGAYLPMDPSYPEERLLYMLEDAGCRLVLIDEATPAALAQRSPVALWLGEGRAAGELDQRVALDEPDAPHGPPAITARDGEEGGELAYVLYTSGSTGRPKGVEVPHAALANFLASMAEQPGLGADDVLLAVTSLSFDIAGLELYLPLVVGGRIELASREEAGDGARLLSRLRSSGATAMQATPSTWRMLIDAGWQGEPAIKVMCGGEALPEKLAAELCARSRSVWNLYGPTETTVWSAAGRVEAGEAVAIGPPIANTTLYVLGRGLEPVPVGVPGELFIGGDGVALGYRGRAELTAERFLPDPFGDRCGRRGRPGARFYRTGDLVRWRPRGELEFLGRIDHQVKVRGFRIELGEVEAALEANPAVAQAVVVAQATPEAGGGRLVAYLVAPAAGPALAVAELRARLAQSLPEHMIPSAWVILDTLPLTPNGKVDRRALPPPDSAPAARAASYVAPRGALEEMIAGIWSEVLGVARVSVHDSFFEMGGHSLLGMQAVSRLGELLETEVPLRGLFEAPTVAGLAGKMVREAGPENDLETAARLVLELLHLTDDQVESLLAQEDGSALSLAPLAGTPPEGEAP